MPVDVGIGRLNSGILASNYVAPAGATQIDAGSRFQNIDGFGAATPFSYGPSGGYSTAVADFLFRADTGIGLTILRSELWVDGSGNGWPTYYTPMYSGGAEAKGDFSNELEAYTRGVRKFLVTCWAPGNGPLSGPWPWLTGGGANAALLAGHYGDMANAFTSYLTAAVAAGLVQATHYVSMMNEPDIAPSYAQTSWTTGQALSFIDNNLGPSLATWASSHPTVPTPGIVFGETSQWSAFATWVNAAEGDSTARGYITQYATHQYGGGGASSPPSPINHPIWETECWNQGSSYDSTMTDAMNVAAFIYNALTTGNASAWLYWFAEDVSDNNNSGLVGTNAANWNNQTASLADWNSPVFPKRAYMMGNFSKFVRPGSTRVNVSNPPSGVNVLAFLCPASSGYRIAIVCINTNGSPTAITVNLMGVGAPQVTPWITDAGNNLVSQAPIPVNFASFSASLTATSVTTFVY